MSHRTSRPRALAMAGLSAAVLAGAAAAPAQAVSTFSGPATCKWPLVGTQPLTFAGAVDVPAQINGGDRLAFDGTLTTGGSTSDVISNLNASAISGEATTLASLSFPSGFTQDILVPLTVERWERAANQIPGPVVLKVKGTTPALTVPGDEAGSLFLTDLDLNLEVFDKSGRPIVVRKITTGVGGEPVYDLDGDVNTFDVSCRLDAPIRVGGPVIDVNIPPSAPADYKAVASKTAVDLSWAASTDPDGTVVGYDVTVAGQPVRVTGTSTRIEGLLPNTTYRTTVVAVDDRGAKGPAAEIRFTTEDDVFVGPEPINYKYSLAGSTTLKTLSKGTLPLSGDINADLTVADGTFVADLALNPTQGRLIASGFLPVTAKVAFVSSGKTTGLLDDGVLTTKSLVRIKLPEVKLFGAIPLAGGNNCQTKSLSTINLRSTDNFDPFAGGALAGTFAISDLNGCGVLNGLVSPLTAGGGNTIALKLTAKAGQ